MTKDERVVIEPEIKRPKDDFEQEDIVNNKKSDDERRKLRQQRAEAKKNEVPMSNGENCGIVEFEGKRINTCEGEKIVEDGYKNPDKN